MPANPGPCRRVHELTPPRPPPTNFPPPSSQLSRPISPHPVNQPRSRKRTDQPPPGAFFAARNTRLRGRRDAGIYMRGTEQKNGREFVLGRRGTSERYMAAGGYESSVYVEFLCRAKRVAVYRRGRIIGDSLFLLAHSSHVPFQFTRPIYRLCSIDYPLRSTFLRPFIHLLSRMSCT